MKKYIGYRVFKHQHWYRYRSDYIQWCQGICALCTKIFAAANI